MSENLGTLQTILELVSAAATLAIAIVSYIWNNRSKAEHAMATKRALIKESADKVDVEFALKFFYSHQVVVDNASVNLGVSDFSKILTNTGWTDAKHKNAQVQLLLFCESLRPIAHVLGSGNPQNNITQMGLSSRVDPIATNARLALQHMQKFFTAAHKTESWISRDMVLGIKTTYCEGDEQEWDCLRRTADLLLGTQSSLVVPATETEFVVKVPE